MVIRVRSTEADHAGAGGFKQKGALETESELANVHHGECERTTVIPYVPKGGKPRPWLITVSGTNMNSRSGERGEELMSFVGSEGPRGRLRNRVQHGTCGQCPFRQECDLPFVVRTNEHAELERQRSHGPCAPE